MGQFTRRFTAQDPAGKGSVSVFKLPERLADFAIRGDSPKYSHDRFRNPLWTMIPMEDEEPAIQREYVELLERKGVEAAVQVVKA